MRLKKAEAEAEAYRREAEAEKARLAAEKEAVMAARERLVEEKERLVEEKERLHAEKARAAMELHQLIQTANAPIFGVDVDGRVTEWNGKAAAITGYTKEEAVGNDLMERFITAEQRASVRNVLSKALRCEETSNYELPLLTKNGARVVVLLNATTRRDADGAIVGVVGIGQDVTQLRRAEEKARRYAGEYSERLCRSFDLSLDLVSQVDFSGPAPHVYYVSPSFEKVLGHPLTSLLGDTSQMTALFPPSVIEIMPSIVSEALSAGSLTFEQPFLHADGREIWFEHKASLHPDDSNCAVIVARDITDRRERHRLEMENTRLTTARAKDEQALHFLAHELKNRFVTMRGLTESARLSVVEHAPHLLEPPHNVQEVFVDTHACINRGVFLCMNRGVALQLAHDTYRPATTTVELATALRTASGRRAEVAVDADVPRYVRLDESLALHVLENFVTNAAKYGEKDGRLTLRSSRHAGRLLLEVTNRPGPKHTEARAVYGDTNAAAAIVAAEGRGLQHDALSTGNGLCIAFKCARLLGGSLSLRFLVDRVVATLVLPLVEIDGDAPALPNGLRVASLDDDADIRALDARLFAKLGFDAHVRGATEEEISGFPSLVANMRPPRQLVFLDENLDHPEHGGHFAKGTDLVAPLRAAGFAGKIVIKSANQSSEERARYEASGADASIDKALMGEALTRELAAILAGEWSWNAGPIDVTVLGATVAEEAAERVRLFRQCAPERAEAVDVHFLAGDGERAWGAAHRLKATASLVGARAVVEACDALRDVGAYCGEEAAAVFWTPKLARLRVAMQKALDALPS